MLLLTKDKIIFALVNKNGQTFKELRASARTNDNSLTRGLEALAKDKLIKQEGKLYYFSTTIRNRLLGSLEGSYSMAKNLEGFMEKLKVSNTPFQISLKMIYKILVLQSMLRVERYSTQKLTKRDKLEFDLYNDIFDAIIEMIFDVLRKKKDPHKFQILKETLFNVITADVKPNK